jgi:hypothetical protein
MSYRSDNPKANPNASKLPTPSAGDKPIRVQMKLLGMLFLQLEKKVQNIKWFDVARLDGFQKISRNKTKPVFSTGLVSTRLNRIMAKS